MAPSDCILAVLAALPDAGPAGPAPLVMHQVEIRGLRRLSALAPHKLGKKRYTEVEIAMISAENHAF